MYIQKSTLFLLLCPTISRILVYLILFIVYSIADPPPPAELKYPARNDKPEFKLQPC